MRGKVQYGRTARRPVRITPAYAGKRKILGGENGGNQDHPRLCGEKEFPRNFNNCITGSPPPMRGKDCRSADNVQRIRIPPAYAGKRQVRCRCPPERQDHPRLCGEKFCTQTGRRRDTGSPPPMRGKVKQKKKSIKFNGITPAYAGKSRLQRQNVVEQGGSPPPMRGKVPTVGTCKTPVGITPAYAGKSHSVPAFSKVLRDHPRLCGEKQIKLQ